MDQKSPDRRVRLNKYLADCGVASRRKADEIIEAGAVTVNGRKVFELGIKVDPKTDKVICNGKPVTSPHRMVYYALNKPKSVVTSNSDPQGRPTVLDFFPKEKLRIFPVGRLDWDSEGLLLMTNDGDFANEIMHPQSKITKTYHVKLSGIPTEAQIEKLMRGVSIVGGKVAAIALRKLAEKTTETKGWMEIVIAEGKNHQVRQMFSKIGHDVIKLRRVAIGEFKLGSLQPGEHKVLNSEDLLRIFKIPKKDVKKDTRKLRPAPKNKDSAKVRAYKKAAQTK